MIFGTFDIFHAGHRNFLKQAKSYGDYLIVVVARDKTIKEVKGVWPQNKEKDRLRVVESSGLASEAVWGSRGDKYAVIKKYRPDVICLGYDQRFFIDNLKSELLKLGLKDTKVVRLRAYHPEIYKSSKLKEKK